MHIRQLRIKNFRALNDVDVEFPRRLSVIVGPNASGKTTVIEAIRLAKALLAPRVQNEPQMILQALGYSTPHAPQKTRFAAIARDPSRPIIVKLSIELGASEIKAIETGLPEISRSTVQAQAGLNYAPVDALISFFNSDQGKLAASTVQKTLEAVLKRVDQTKKMTLDLLIDPASGPRSTGNQIEAQMIAFLERKLPPYQTGFTYYPADRALPMGEQPVQLGGADAAQQMESYNSQPQIKFSRLKSAIFGAPLSSSVGIHGSKEIDGNFKDIFEGILRGRELERRGINEIGMLSVAIRDIETGNIFDIDAMSSGEKGLLLTFLSIATSVVDDGLILFDEPELHLNPAVCKQLIVHLLETYLEPRNLQAIICSHSPEILASAFENEDCAVYHLRNPDELTRVSNKNDPNLDEAFQRLGATQVEGLLYKGLIIVEGPDDVSILENCLPMLLRRHKIRTASGRFEIERAIRSLESSHLKEGDISTYFIFDNDGKPIKTNGIPGAKFLQWDRYCLENFLLDEDVISEIANGDRKDHDDEPISAGKVLSIMRSLAMSQIPNRAMRTVVDGFSFSKIYVTAEESANNEEGVIALGRRYEALKLELSALSPVDWQEQLRAKLDQERQDLTAKWDLDWRSECDGKKVLSRLALELKIRLSTKNFKLRIAKEMASKQTQRWKELELQIKSLLSSET